MEAHLQVQDGSPIDRMSPFVILRINGAGERRTEVNEYGGRNPRWIMQFFEWELFDLNHELFIEVRDKDMIGSQFLGQARIPIGRFARDGGNSERIELFFNGFPAGNIHLKSEYWPQAIFGGVQQPMVKPTVVV